MRAHWHTELFQVSKKVLPLTKIFPIFNINELENLRNLSYKELATKIIYEFCSDEFSENEIKNLVEISYRSFRAKDVVKIQKLGKLNLLELTKPLFLW